MTHTIDSLLKRLDAIKTQKSRQNKPSTSSASQICEITLPAPASEHTNESRKLNSTSAMPSNVQHDTFAAQSDDNEMDINIITRKRAIREVSSEEEPTSPLPTKRTAPGPLPSGQDGTFVPKGVGRGGPSKISTFCPNPPRSGGQGSYGRDRSPIRLPGGTEPSVPPKPVNQSKSKKDKNSPHKIMAHNYIIQWNCRGLRSNREDIELLISKYSPAAICLQETMLTRDQIQTFKHYSAYYKK